MITTFESIVPEIGDDIFGDPINADEFVAFAGRVAYLPICNHTDLRRSVLYSHDPLYYEDQDRSTHPERGQAYAWRRVPRFFDRFKEVRDGMRQAYPNELILCLDIGSSVPLYPELMRAHWLRKGGNFAADSMRAALAGYKDKSDSSAKMMEVHMRRNSEFKAAFISCLQVALYCIPYELSGDSVAISGYLKTTMRMLLANSKRFINRKDNKDTKNLQCTYESLGIDYEPNRIQRVPMERAWRIDAYLSPESDMTPLEMLEGTTFREPLTPAEGKEVEGLHKAARSADDHGDSVLAKNLRRKATNIIQAQDLRGVDRDDSIVFIEEVLSLAVDWAVEQGYACPVRFLSLDRADPKDLLVGMESGLDVETKLSGFGRRVRERLGGFDPDHIVDDVANVGDHLEPESLALATSIESYPFYAEQPQRIRDLELLSRDISGNMIGIMETLRRKGEFVTFPWGKMPDYGGRSKSAQIAIDMLPERIIEKLARYNSLGRYVIEQQVHSPEEVAIWFSQGEFDSLHGLSPALNLDAAELVRILRIRRVKNDPPKGVLLGIKNR